MVRSTPHGATRGFARNVEGSLATWTAAVAFPLFMAAALAVDMQSASQHRAAIANAADSAVLAAALHGGLNAREKRDFAERQFRDVFSGNPDTLRSVRANVDGSRVTLDVRSQFPSKLSYFTQVNDSEFVVARAAETTDQDTICILALNDTARGAVEFSENVRLNAPNCSVQTNSIHPSALINTSSRIPLAKGFCATGGAQGDFGTTANTECAPVADPYAGTPAPEPGPCAPQIAFTNIALMPTMATTGPTMGPSLTVMPTIGTLDPMRVPLEADDSTNVVVDLETLTPGTYCGGLTIAGRDVRLLPGEYIMKDGPFVIKDGATVDAPGVLVSLSGIDAKLKVETGGALDITAPSTGPRAGLAVMQDLRGPIGNIQLMSTIDDAALSMTGTLYLPKQWLEITGSSSSVGAAAPATSFIVDRIALRGGGTVGVAVDHLSAGLPPIQPRSDEGARLVR